MNKSTIWPGATAPQGTVMDMLVSGITNLAPALVTEAHVVNLLSVSILCWTDIEDLPPPEELVEPPDDVVFVVPQPSTIPEGGGGGVGNDGNGVELFGKDAMEAPCPTTFTGSQRSNVPPTDVPGLE